MATRGSSDERAWERGWEAHARAQRRRLASLSLVEKLAWLEEAHRLVRHLRRPDDVTRTPHDDPPERPPAG